MLTLCGSYASFAQHQHTTNHNAWFMYFGDHKFSKKWGLHLEAQLRRSDGISKGQQLLLRPGINYHFAPAAFASLGYGFVETYPYGEFASKSSFPEHRLWEQMQFKQMTNRLEWVNRLRLEQRWVQSPMLQGDDYKPGPSVYTNRMRLLNRLSVPLNHKTIAEHTVYVSAYDELFVNFGKKVAANVFDQNRAYLALGYRFPRIGRLEAGYMFQKIFKPDGIKVEDNHTLMLSLISNFDLK